MQYTQCTHIICTNMQCTKVDILCVYLVYCILVHIVHTYCTFYKYAICMHQYAIH